MGALGSDVAAHPRPPTSNQRLKTAVPSFFGKDIDKKKGIAYNAYYSDMLYMQKRLPYEKCR